MSVVLSHFLTLECRLDYNYFVSVPIAAPTVQLQLAAFKQQVLSSREAAAAGIEGSLFTDERKLHLTIAMLKLYTEARRQKAVQVLLRSVSAPRGMVCLPAIAISGPLQ